MWHIQATLRLSKTIVMFLPQNNRFSAKTSQWFSKNSMCRKTKEKNKQ